MERPKKPRLPVPTPPIISEKSGEFHDTKGIRYTTYTWFSDRGAEIVSYYSPTGTLFCRDQYFYSESSPKRNGKADIVRYYPDSTVFGRSITYIQSDGASRVILYNSTGIEITIESWENLK